MTARRTDMIAVHIEGRADGGAAVDYTVNSAVGIPMQTGPVDGGRSTTSRRRGTSSPGRQSRPRCSRRCTGANGPGRVVGSRSRWPTSLRPASPISAGTPRRCSAVTVRGTATTSMGVSGPTSRRPTVVGSWLSRCRRGSGRAWARRPGCRCVGGDGRVIRCRLLHRRGSLRAPGRDRRPAAAVVRAAQLRGGRGRVERGGCPLGAVSVDACLCRGVSCRPVVSPRPRRGRSTRRRAGHLCQVADPRRRSVCRCRRCEERRPGRQRRRRERGTDGGQCAGADTDEILASVLGLSDAELAKLHDLGVI